MKISVIYGINAVGEALKTDKNIEKIFIASQKIQYKPFLKTAKQKNIPIQLIPKEALAKKAGSSKHQGVLAILSGQFILDLEQLLEICKLSKKLPLVAVLDQIEDPHNLGAIIRSAEAAGFNGIIIQTRRSASLSPVVSKISAGAINHLPVARVNNLARAIDRLKENKFWVIGSDEKAKESFWDISVDMPIALVIGNEGTGIRRLLKEKCDFVVSIPMFGKTDSLNVSVAAALLFYEIQRKRTRGSK